MGCGQPNKHSIQNNVNQLTFDQQLMEIDKEDFFQNLKPFQIVLQPILQNEQKAKDETDSQDDLK